MEHACSSTYKTRTWQASYHRWYFLIKRRVQVGGDAGFKEQAKQLHEGLPHCAARRCCKKVLSKIAAEKCSRNVLSKSVVKRYCQKMLAKSAAKKCSRKVSAKKVLPKSAAKKRRQNVKTDRQKSSQNCCQKCCQKVPPKICFS